MHTSLVDYNSASLICKNGAPYSHIYRPSLICMHWFIGLFMFLRLCILRVDFDCLTFPPHVFWWATQGGSLVVKRSSHDASWRFCKADLQSCGYRGRGCCAVLRFSSTSLPTLLSALVENVSVSDGVSVMNDVRRIVWVERGTSCVSKLILG
jgi:hypothetical protein